MHRTREVKYRQETAEYVGSFQAMASPCEVLIQTTSQREAKEITNIVCDEAARIEQKYSRYCEDNIIHKIHQHNRVEVDQETARLLDFAKTAHQLSEGRFDISSGVLRKLWDFSKEDAKVPSRVEVKALLSHVGWGKINWDGSIIQVPEGMEIDFGGFGKEYAVDKALACVTEKFGCPVLVNFGGDLAANKAPTTREHWSVGVRCVANSHQLAKFKFKSGAIATSGNQYRFINHKGKKLTHILNAQTGWPVSNPPISISVAMGSCLQAGFLSTLASLMGKKAELFLQEQQVKHWIQR